MTSPTTIKRLRELLEKATPGEWEIHDSCSWRRIGTPERDGNVLCPYVSHTDGHPDLMAGRGEDVYANLRLIVEMKRHLPALLDRVEAMEKAQGAANSIDFQQRRGAAWDVVDEAIAAYDGWMLDDDYEAGATLRKIIDRMRERRNAFNPEQSQ